MSAAPRTLLTARWVLGHAEGRHQLLRDGELVVQGDRILFAGRHFPGAVDARFDAGEALIAPGFIDLDALADLDTTILALDNQPGWRKGRVWPRSYQEAGPAEMYSAEELAFQKRHAFAQLIRNGVTSALPISSLFYREWGETVEEFEAAAEAAIALGLRVWLGPAYRTGHLLVDEAGAISEYFDEARGLAELDNALRFCRDQAGRGGGLVSAMLTPDRIETCTPALLRRTAEAGRELGVPVRLHCCQSLLEYQTVLRLRGMTPPEWLDSLGFLRPGVLLPHGVWTNDSPGIARPGRDLEIIAQSGASIVHCPLVMARGGSMLRSFPKLRALGINIGLGTDTAPPDFFLNMQLGLMLARIAEGSPTACRSEDMLDAATLGGAIALGRDDLGRLQPGARADLIVVELGRPQHGQVIDPVQTLMVAGQGRDVRDVMIDGRWVMRDRVIPGVDELADAARAQAQFDRLVSRYPQRTLGHPPVAEIFSSSYPRG
ncbi:amidohydrolase family protein [Roseomonas sp. USHLN139]|uniref:amidohydrolase family protein n=1 Tax=Roseomonas sp. USHLN139 TaxID=3081298 RepID=UPI003B0152AC